MRNGHTDSSIVAKAGIWYTVCNFTFKGLAFITTPIFTRLLTKTEIGYFSNFASWVSILAVLTSFDFSQSIIRSKLDHKDDMDCYIWSILCLSTLWTLVVYGIVCAFPHFFEAFFQMEMKHIHIMFLYFLTTPAYTMIITKHRAFYKYKSFVAMTAFATLMAVMSSLVLVVLMQDKVTGRIIGHYVPYIIVGSCIYVYLASRGRKIKTQYWKFACTLCIPLVPHVLSMNLLNSSDKIIITKLCGNESTAIYSIAYNCYHIATILLDSLNKAWAPWLLDSLHAKKYSEIKKTSRYYILIFASIAFAVTLVAPEIVLILGGKTYSDASFCIPPLISSCMIQLMYTMYVNVEFYLKRTIGVSLATMIATFVNIGLNYAIIPINLEYGFAVAAYTTLVGYIVLFCLHYLMVKHYQMDFIFDTKFIFLMLAVSVASTLPITILYRLTLIRYIFALVYVLIIGCVTLKSYRSIKGMLKRK